MKTGKPMDPTGQGSVVSPVKASQEKVHDPFQHISGYHFLHWEKVFLEEIIKHILILGVMLCCEWAGPTGLCIGINLACYCATLKTDALGLPGYSRLSRLDWYQGICVGAKAMVTHVTVNPARPGVYFPSSPSELPGDGWSMGRAVWNLHDHHAGQTLMNLQDCQDLYFAF